MANVWNYCPDAVSVLVAGLIPVDGFVDGTFISIDKDVMPFSSTRTTDGIVSRLYNSDSTYTVKITLTNGASTNDLFTKLWQIDEITQMGKIPLMIKDQSGSDLFFSPTAWIETLPSLTKSAGVDSRVWTFKAAQCVINIGGNDSPSSLLDDIINIASSALPILEGVI